MTTTISGPRIGSLFSGYGGLDMGVQAVIGGSVVWHVEFADAPSKILAHHWPDVPNYHDVTTVDWAAVEPVDVLTGGFPCQDVSLAGARAGLMDGTRSGLWSEYAKAIDVLRPSLVLIENVRGLLSAKTMEEVDETDSDMEWEPRSVGESTGLDRPVLNAFGRVLGDLAELGYVGRWLGIRAADAGAPHGRYRVFVLAYPRGGQSERWGGSRELGSSTQEGRREGDQREWLRHPTRHSGATPSDAAGEPGRVRNGDDVSTGSREGRFEPPTGASPPQDADFAAGGEWWLSAPDEAEGGRAWSHAGGRGGALAGDADFAGLEGRKLSGERPGERIVGPDDLGLDTWGDYWPAIRRWEAVTESAAPSPTKADGKEGSHRLSAEFVEWMMGLPAGHVTDPAIGLSRNDQLKALGNGVVWQQAALALSLLLAQLEPHNIGKDGA